MNVVTRRMMCLGCGKQFDVTPWLGGAWHITQAVDKATPFIVAATRPVCTDPRCESRALADMNSERVMTDAGDVIVLENSERPELN